MCFTQTGGNQRRMRARHIIIALAGLLGAAGAWAQLAPTQGPYTEGTLDGLYNVQDLFAERDGAVSVGTGSRDFDGRGEQDSLVSRASRSPLDYSVTPDGAFRLTGDGTIGLGGALAVFTPDIAAGVDGQISEGYAAMRLSLLSGGNRTEADFAGDYSWHALVFDDNGWFNQFGVFSANGQGDALLTRATGGLAFDYDVNASGQVSIGEQGRRSAALQADGAFIAHTINIDPGDDPAYPAGFEGLALYLRRTPSGTTFDPATLNGRYRVHSLRVDANGAVAARVSGLLARDGALVFDDAPETLVQPQFNARGTFTFAGDEDRIGTVGAGGDLVVVSPDAPDTGAPPVLELWVRTAGGGPVPGDADGDGLRNADDSDDNDADRDNDGLIDGWDPAPDEADNVAAATLSQSDFDIIEGEDRIGPLTLTLDAGDFPFFAWSLSADRPWVDFAFTAGTGSDTVEVTLDTRGLVVEDSPYTATIRVDAPGISGLAPIDITVNVGNPAIAVALDPSALTFAAIAGRDAPPAQNVAVSSPDDPAFRWTAAPDAAWLNVAPLSGTGAQDVSVSVDPAGLAAGQSPFEAQVTFTARDSSAPPATLDVTLNLLAARDLDDVFPVSPQFTTQTEPAAAYAPGAGYVIAWLERDAVRASILADDATPIAERRLLSLEPQGPAARPALAARGSTGEVWALWTQRPVTGGSLLAGRAIDVAPGTTGPLFGLAGGGGPTTVALAYDGATDAFGVAVRATVQSGDDTAEGIELRRYDAATQELRARVVVATGSQVARPAIAYDPVAREWLVAWEDGAALTAQRFEAVSLAPRGASINLGAGAEPVPAYNAGGREWAVLVRRSDGLTLLRFDAGREAPPVVPVLVAPSPIDERGIAFRYGPQSAMLRAAWGAGDGLNARVATRRRTAGGTFFDTATLIDPIDDEQFTPAIAYNGSALEWLVVWIDRRGIFRQVFAQRRAAVDADADGDGLPNDWELTFGLDPQDGTGDNGANGDPDGDGLTNREEFEIGTDPTLADTDGDGLLDPQEDPNTNGVIDAGETDPTLADTDGDAFGDAAERYLGSDGNDAASTPPAGIARVAYGAWVPGAAQTVTFEVAVSRPGDYTLTLDVPGTWTATPPPMDALVGLTPGSYTVEFTVSPPAALSVESARADVQVSLNGPGVSDGLALRWLVDARATAADATTLAARFAPLLRYHRGEELLPLPVEALLADGVLRPRPGVALSAPTDARALQQAARRGARLDLPGTDVDTLRAAAADAEPKMPTLYYSVVRVDGLSSVDASPDATVIQYFLLHYLDDWGARMAGGHRHEGDWEAVQVFLDASGAPQRVTVTRQLERAEAEAQPGRVTYAWETLERDGDHPVLFVAAGSHALYARPGSARLAGGRDVADGAGPWLTPPGSNTGYPDAQDYTLSRLPRLAEDGALPWQFYAGRFGQADLPASPDDAPTPNAQDGAPGPAFLADSELWIDPAAWAERGAAPRPEETTTLEGSWPAAPAGAELLLLGPRGEVLALAVDEDGRFSGAVPARTYVLAGVSRDGLGQPVFVAALAHTFAGADTLLTPTLPGGTTDLGTLVESDGVLRSGTDPYAARDSDGDGTPDAADDDADGDGRANAQDDDALGDGFLDRAQAGDANENLIPDAFEDAGTADDFDGDGRIDALDIDDDNDEFSDAVERMENTDPRNPFDTPDRRAGDMDEDGDVDAADLQLLTARILQESGYVLRGDLRPDGVLDTTDIARLIERILGR